MLAGGVVAGAAAAGAEDREPAVREAWSQRLAVRTFPGPASFYRERGDGPGAVAAAFDEARAAVEPEAVPWALRWLAEAERDPAAADVEVTTAVLKLLAALPVAEAAPRLAALLRRLPVRPEPGEGATRGRLQLRDHVALALANAEAGAGAKATPGEPGDPVLGELEAAMLDLSLTGHARMTLAALAAQGRASGRVALVAGDRRYLDLNDANEPHDASVLHLLRRSNDAELARLVALVGEERGEGGRSSRLNLGTVIERIGHGRAPLADLRAWAADPAWERVGRREHAVQALAERGEPQDVPLLLNLPAWDQQRLAGTQFEERIRDHGADSARRIRERLWREVACGRQLRGDFGAEPVVRFPDHEPAYPEAFLDGTSDGIK